MPTDSEMLAEVPLFAQLSESERTLLAERIDIITVESGTTMFTSPASAIHLLAATGQRLRNTVGLLRPTASRNPNIEIEDSRTVVMKVADLISEFSGSLPFLFIHVGLFRLERSQHRPTGPIDGRKL